MKAELTMIFVDTGAFYDSLVETAKHHDIISTILQEVHDGKWGVMITTNYILDELYTLIRMRINHPQAVSIGTSIRTSISDKGNIQIVWITPEIEQLAWDTFVKYQDKRFSFTDCTSFAVMDLLGMNTSFTTDVRHYRQMGYQVIPEI